jgi:ATP-dependent helicase HrpB
MWQSRVMSLRVWRGDEWPDVTDQKLLSSLHDWLAPFLTTASKKQDLEKLNWAEILPTLLPWELQSKLNKLAPEKLEVPSGSMIRIQYKPDGSDPFIEVRLQELFGLLETPTVNEGKTRIVVHLLSPGYKPVQVTRDLRSFWTTTYHEVRKELKIRYPKHSWPEDPFTARAVRGVRR